MIGYGMVGLSGRRLGRAAL